MKMNTDLTLNRPHLKVYPENRPQLPQGDAIKSVG